MWGTNSCPLKYPIRVESPNQGGQRILHGCGRTQAAWTRKGVSEWSVQGGNNIVVKIIEGATQMPSLLRPASEHS